MEDDYFKLPLDTCLYVDFDGDKYSVLRNGTKEYGIGEMICEMGNVTPCEVIEVLLQCSNLSEKPTMDLLSDLFVELDRLLVDRFGLVAGAIICNEMLSVSSELMMDKKKFIKDCKEVIPSEKSVYDFVFVEPGYDGPGVKDIKQFLLTAYYVVANSLVTFKYLYLNVMKIITGDQEEQKNGLKIKELYGSFVAAQHIDYKIMLFENRFANVYGIQTAISLLAFEFANAYNHGIGFAKCKNCGRFFVLTGRVDTAYCPYPNSEHEGRTCREIGAQITRRNKEKNDIATGEYRKLYMRMKMQSRRHPKDSQLKTSLDALVAGGKDWRDRMETGAATTEEFMQWLNSFKN